MLRQRRLCAGGSMAAAQMHLHGKIDSCICCKEPITACAPAMRVPATPSWLCAHSRSSAAVQSRDPIPAFKTFCLEHGLLTEEDMASIDSEISQVIDDAVEFADESPRPEKGQLLENVFADPKGFGFAADGEYRYTKPGFTGGAVQVS